MIKHWVSADCCYIWPVVYWRNPWTIGFGWLAHIFEWKIYDIAEKLGDRA